MAKRRSAKKFLEGLKAEFPPLRNKILSNPFVVGVKKGKAPVEKLKYFIDQQFYIVSVEFRSLPLYIAFIQISGSEILFLI